MFTNFIIPAYSVFCEGRNRVTFTEVTAPKSTESTNSTMPAYSVGCFRRGGLRPPAGEHSSPLRFTGVVTSYFYTGRYPGWGISPDPRFIKTGEPVFIHFKLTNNPMHQEEKKLKRRKQIPPYSFAPGTDETKAKAEHCAQQTFARSRVFQNTKFKAKD